MQPQCRIILDTEFLGFFCPEKELLSLICSIGLSLIFISYHQFFVLICVLYRGSKNSAHFTVTLKIIYCISKVIYFYTNIEASIIS